MDEDFSIDFRRQGATGLYAHARGAASLETTMACWQAILAEIALRRPRFLLLVDELRGAPLAAGEWEFLVKAMAGRGLEGVRIAHVKPHGLDSIEHCEIYATEAGLQARVFADERAAERWLRYGGAESV